MRCFSLWCSGYRILSCCQRLHGFGGVLLEKVGSCGIKHHLLLHEWSDGCGRGQKAHVLAEEVVVRKSSIIVAVCWGEW